MCSGCPFNLFSFESEQAQNYGCLPDPWTIVDYYQEGRGHWKCHEAKRKCRGLAQAKKQLEIQGTQSERLYANGDNGTI